VVDQIQTCYRHPDRRAGVHCQRCDRLICPDCMRQASVGFHCPDCTKTGKQKVVRGAAAFGGVVTRPVVTQVLIAMNVAVFALAMTSGGSLQSSGRLGTDFGLIGSGRLNNGTLIGVSHGEWYRIITSGFLHAGPIHLAFNMYALYILGTMLEGALGPYRFAALYVAALIAGSFGVLLVEPNGLTVGASGAVFGIMGASVLAQRLRGIDPFASGLGSLLVINLIFTFAIPGISIGGHIGGLIGGFVAGWILLDAGPKMTKSKVVPTLACLGLAAALFAACLLVA
jgi:membrane associated rhomboid family serine protease